ncbi:MAG: hypothetical protein V3G42_00900 [Oscillospiraceae bacterium]
MIYNFTYEYFDRAGRRHLGKQSIRAQDKEQALQELKDFCTELNRAIINVKIDSTREEKKP